MKKRFRSEFKRKVVLAALKGNKSLVELASEFSVHAEQIKQWKDEVLRVMKEAFEKKHSSEYKKQEQLVNSLYKEIGIMKMEKEFLKKKLKQVGIE